MAISRVTHVTSLSLLLAPSCHFLSSAFLSPPFPNRGIRSVTYSPFSTQVTSSSVLQEKTSFGQQGHLVVFFRFRVPFLFSPLLVFSSLWCSVFTSPLSSCSGRLFEPSYISAVSLKFRWFSVSVEFWSASSAYWILRFVKLIP